MKTGAFMRAARFIICFVMLITASPVLGATSGEDELEYQVCLQEGLDLLRSGSGEDLRRAIARFKSALKLKPESAEAYYWIALTYSDMNVYVHAAENAKDATIYDDRMAEAWLLWGQTLLYQKEWNDALEKLETAARLAPDDPMIQFNLGRVYYHGFKDPDSALPRFRAVWQQASAVRREQPEAAALVMRARLYMGFCEFDRKRWDNAINAFRDVLQEQPGNFDAYLRLALCYRHSSRPRECEEMLKNMIKAIPPDSFSNRQYLAEVNLQLADLYIKEPAVRNSLFAMAHLNEFVHQIGDTSHPALDPAREYLIRNELQD